MTGPLDEWQERLERHFESLARTRAEACLPIFALEHGLSEEELSQISPILRSRLKARLPLAPHWLLWVIYATERGYSYTGDEYWRSFEEQTPEWEIRDRDRIKPWFRKFQKAYQGVVPSGPWAEQFRIIAWPITHAILPRYLQHQFARCLYDLRFRLASLATLDPDTVGRVLAGHAHHASTRFQKFLQQEELTGRIVLALLGAEPTEGKEPIYPPTLRRIVSDLEKVHSAREWLKETQRVFSDGFKGIGRGSGPPAERPPIGPPGTPGADAARIAVRPNLLLRHAGGGTWSVLLEVPSFRSVAALVADVQSFLQRTRCRLNGGNDMKPTGWLLSGNRKGALRRWPDPARPLIQFERSHPVLDDLLESECRLSPGPIWLFRIRSDGTAHEITGRVVRPGCAYIVATAGEVPQAHDGMSPCKLDCEGVRSFRLSIQPEVSAETTEWLHQIGLQVARTIRVWPAGLPGRGWDGEGSGEWLTTEAPCFGIAHDHPVDGYTIRLNNGPEAVIGTSDPGKPVFVRVPPLPAGTHSLVIKARRNPSLDALAPSPPAEGFVQLTVREPEPWTPGVAAHPGLIVTIDPHDPDLDTFWRNEVSLSVIGPEGYAVNLSVSLESADGREILSEQVGAAMDLPVTPEAWRRRFGQFLQREDHAWSYLEAASGTLAIEGETLGRCALRFEHDAQPLRWVLRRDHGDIILRLVDDSGQDGSKPEVHFYSMERPLKAVPVAPEMVFSGIPITPAGGLFLARHGLHADTVVISARLADKDLPSGIMTLSCPEVLDGSVSIPASLQLLELWQDARLPRFLTGRWVGHVTDDIVRALYEALYGHDWMTAEKDFIENRNSQEVVNRLECEVGGKLQFSASLRRDYVKECKDIVAAASWYKRLAEHYGLNPKRNECSFAFTLAMQPKRLHRIYGTELSCILNSVENKPPILRGARFLTLLVESQSNRLTH